VIFVAQEACPRKQVASFRCKKGFKRECLAVPSFGDSSPFTAASFMPWTAAGERLVIVGFDQMR